MPLYEYACDQCKEIQEVLQKVGDPAPDKCPHCGAQNSLQKVVSSSAFHLKGGGWYKDLYSSPKPASEKKSSDDKLNKKAGDKK